MLIIVFFLTLWQTFFFEYPKSTNSLGQNICRLFYVLAQFLLITHCVKSVRILSYSGPHFSLIFPHSDWMWRDTELFWSAFFPHFPAFGLNTPYLSVFSPNAGKCGKNAGQNNPEYGLFLRNNKWNGTRLLSLENEIRVASQAEDLRS